MKLIIDTDPGIDDAMAWFYAHASPRIEIIALTTIFGNVSIEDATRNAQWLVEFSNAGLSVYAGAAAPMVIPAKPPAAEVHGKHGFGTYKIDSVVGASEDESACDYLVRVARQQPGELVLCAVGPLTNVARAIEKDADFVTNLKQLVIMGGSLRAGGNVTSYAEANFWQDPHAADIVLKAPGDGEILIVGLDVTHQVTLGPASFQKIAEVSRRTGAFVEQIADFYFDFYESRKGVRTVSLHDPAAVIACTHPEFFDLERHRLAVINSSEKAGMMISNDSKNDTGRECYVCMNVDAARVVAEFEQVIALND